MQFRNPYEALGGLGCTVMLIVLNLVVFVLKITGVKKNQLVYNIYITEI